MTPVLMVQSYTKLTLFRFSSVAAQFTMVVHLYNDDGELCVNALQAEKIGYYF